jgi:NADH-quinone oxidoreductase subunit E
MEVQFSLGEIGKIVDGLGAKPSSIIAILQEIQEKYRYIPPESFPYLSKRLKVSEARIYSVATFYENFSLDPKGKFVIRICDGTACHVRKSIPILNKLRESLGLSESKLTTGDLGFTVETVSCLGACGLAPVMTVNEKVYPAMTPEKAETLLAELKTKLEN